MEPSINRLVHILLSTHNGEAFIREQMDSLIRQNYPHIIIHVRDDGSVDDTPKILREYGEKHFHVKIVCGENVGVNKSFYELLGVESGPHDLFAFCDQDDVWDKDKILQAVNRLSLSSNSASALYFSRYQFVDEDLKKIRISAFRRHLYFSNAVVESGVAGCTMVFGSVLRDIMLYSDPDDWNMHDWWAYLVATAFGEVVFDSRSRMQYRRHSKNTTAWEKRKVAKALARLRLFLQRHEKGNTGMVSLQQAGRFVRQYENIIAPKLRDIVLELEHLQTRGNAYDRFLYVIKPHVRRESIFEHLALLLVIALGQH
jgi:glycosyltransferase involved in cell wall biosynthesis